MPPGPRAVAATARKPGTLQRLSTQPLCFRGSWQAVGSVSGTDFQERASQPVKCSAALVAYADLE